MLEENKKCENCDNDHDGKYGSGRFCSSICARGFSTKNKRSLINEKVSSKLRKHKTEYIYNKLCLCCSNKFETKKEKQLYCSLNCAKNRIITQETKDKISKSIQSNVKNGTHVGWQSRKIRSYAELFFENVLNNNNIKYNAEFKLNKRDLGFDNSSCYFLDFYLHEYNVNLEIDGKQHEYSERKESDKIRDEAIIKYGIFVYRIKWKNPYKNEEYIKNEINNFLIYLDNI